MVFRLPGALACTQVPACTDGVTWVHVLQGRPHAAGVPHDASHAAPLQQPPPKAAAKPGRKPKALPAAGALAIADHSTPGLLQPSRSAERPYAASSFACLMHLA
jgi:hypothetical protein